MVIEAGEEDDLVELTTLIVAAYCAGNHLPATELPRVIREVHTSLQALAFGTTKPAETQRVLTPADIRRSIQPDGLISFEDGKAYKTLRRHLALHGLTPEAYRAKWGLPADYPMTAPAYSAQRSQLARDLGLGRPRGSSSEPLSSGPDEAAKDRESPAADPEQSGSLDLVLDPEQAELDDEFEEGITRERFDEDGVEP